MKSENLKALRSAIIGGLLFTATMSLIDYMDDKSFSLFKCTVQFVIFGGTTFVINLYTAKKKKDQQE
jgi:poly(3-hydroxyalkanoate) synthetase